MKGTIIWSININALLVSGLGMTSFNILNIVWPTFPSCSVSGDNLQPVLQRERDYKASASWTNHGD